MSCDGKRRYRDKWEALEVAYARQRAGAGYLRAYECPRCRGGHLTRWERDRYENRPGRPA